MSVIHIFGREKAANTIIADQSTALATAHGVLKAVKRYQILIPPWLVERIDSTIALIEGASK